MGSSVALPQASHSLLAHMGLRWSVRVHTSWGGGHLRIGSEEDGVPLSGPPRQSYQWLLLSWGDYPSPTPWEAGCTWGWRKEGEEVRQQEFPGALFPAEIMRDVEEEGRRGPQLPKQPSRLLQGNSSAQRALAPSLSPC